MAAAVPVRALQGEALDALVWRALGDTAGVEAVLEANPGIAARAEALTEGEAVMIPTIAKAAAEAPLIQLWD